jgi:ABC-2 type transport system permease protein
VIAFAAVARTNAGLSDEALASIGRPIQVEASALEGGTTPLSSFAVAVAVSLSLMLLAILLAAGTLALEREENAFGRLLRGLVSRTVLIAEKAALGAVCSGAVSDGLYDLIRAISALFPFEPALSAIDVALGEGGDIVPPLLHLLALALAFGAIGRLALRRLA